MRHSGRQDQSSETLFLGFGNKFIIGSEIDGSGEIALPSGVKYQRLRLVLKNQRKQKEAAEELYKDD